MNLMKIAIKFTLIMLFIVASMNLSIPHEYLRAAQAQTHNSNQNQNNIPMLIRARLGHKALQVLKA